MFLLRTSVRNSLAHAKIVCAIPQIRISKEDKINEDRSALGGTIKRRCCCTKSSEKPEAPAKEPAEFLS